METFFGFILGLTLGLVVSIPFGVMFVYIMISRRVNHLMTNAGAAATGIAGRLINRAVKSHLANKHE